MTTTQEIRPVAWALFWRTTVAGFLVGFIAGAIFGFIVGFIGTLLGFDAQLLSTISTWGGGIVGLIASFFAFSYILAWMIGKSFGGKTLLLS